MALGCSTNSVLHLLAIANEAGVPMDLATINAVSARVPNLCHLAPAGPTHIEDLYAAGGVQAVMKQLADAGLLHTELPTVAGKTLGENLAGPKTGIPMPSAPWITPTAPPAASRSVGNIAKDGCVVEQRRCP